MRGSDFMELRAFEIVARRQSFSRAAEEIGMSRAGLSQIVKALEEKLGVQLLKRTTRNVSVTDAGQELLDKLSPALIELVAAVENIDRFRDGAYGEIRVLTSQFGMDQCLLAMLPKLAEALPNVVFDISIQERSVELVSGGFDTALWAEGQVDLDLVGFKVANGMPRRLLASKSYLSKAGTPTRLADLQSQTIVCLRSDLEHKKCVWRFNVGEQSAAATLKPALVVDNFHLAKEAVSRGVGIAYLPALYAQSEVDAGLASFVLEDHWSLTKPLFLYHPKHSVGTAAFRTFTKLMSALSKQFVGARLQ